MDSFVQIFLLVFLYTGLLHAQIERWIYRYNDPSDSIDSALSLVYGSDGNIYAAGVSTGIGTYDDFTVISLTTTGDTNWVYRYNGPGNSADAAYSIVYGSDGNIYAAGGSTGIGTYDDFTVISLTTAGEINWVYRYNGSGYFRDRAYSIVYGSDGNIYAAGMSSESGTGYGFVVISLTSSGDERWIYTYAATSYVGDHALSIVYGLDGNLYAAGTSVSDYTSFDLIVISLSTSGTERWVYGYSGISYGMDVAYSIIYGLDGNIYTTGYSYEYATNYDFIVISLTASGTERWVYRYDGPTNAEDFGHSIVYGSYGNIYAAGRSIGSGAWNDFDFTVISLTTAGDRNWVYRYNGPGSWDDRAYSIVYGSDDNIYAAGYSEGSGTWFDFTIISLTFSGVERWVYRYNGPGNWDDRANSIVYGSDGNIYAAGFSEGELTYSDFTVISLNPEIGVEEYAISLKPEDRFEISSAFFNKKISLRFANSSKTPLEIILYDIVGNIVYKTFRSSTPSYLELSDAAILRLPKGIYFLLVLQNKKTYPAKKLVKF